MLSTVLLIIAYRYWIGFILSCPPTVRLYDTILILSTPTGCALDVMNLFGLGPVLLMQSDCLVFAFYLCDQLCVFVGFLYRLHLGMSTVSTLLPSCGPQSDQR